MTDTLFALPDANAGATEPTVGEPQVLRPNRAQLKLRPVDLEGLLRADHRARVVWEFVEGLDLAPLYAEIRAVEGHAGRPAIRSRDPDDCCGCTRRWGVGKGAGLGAVAQGA